jgi:peptidoglycan hydrolase CwlO-like protein
MNLTITPTSSLSALFKDKLASVSKIGNSRMYLERICSIFYILVLKKVYFRTFCPENQDQRQQQTTQQHSQYEDDLDSLLNQGSPADRSDVQSKCCAQAITSSRGGNICGWVFILIKRKMF